MIGTGGRWEGERERERERERVERERERERERVRGVCKEVRDRESIEIDIIKRREYVRE